MTKEQVYDEQIFPLMAQILEICEARKIAMVASFAIPNDEDPDLCCSSALTTAEYEPPEYLKAAVRVISGSARGAGVMLRTEHADGSQTLTEVLG